MIRESVGLFVGLFSMSDGRVVCESVTLYVGLLCMSDGRLVCESVTLYVGLLCMSDGRLVSGLWKHEGGEGFFQYTIQVQVTGNNN